MKKIVQNPCDHTVEKQSMCNECLAIQKNIFTKLHKTSRYLIDQLDNDDNVSSIIDHKCTENLVPHYTRKTEQFYKEDERCIQAVQVLYENGQMCNVCSKMYRE